jgi:hypothetical protein
MSPIGIKLCPIRFDNPDDNSHHEEAQGKANQDVVI